MVKVSAEIKRMITFKNLVNLRILNSKNTI